MPAGGGVTTATSVAFSGLGDVGVLRIAVDGAKPHARAGSDAATTKRARRLETRMVESYQRCAC